MKMNRVLIFIALIFAVIVFSFGRSASAQQARPQFLFTWHAENSYVPSFYKGKIIPGSQSQITAAFELVENGKIINVSGQPIYWYLDNTLIGGGTGIQQVTFSPFGRAPEVETLKVDLPNYSGGYLIHEIGIPVFNPSAVIETPYPDNQFSGQAVTTTALAYFFNTPEKNLSFTWSVNGQSGSNTESPDVLQVNFPNQTPSGSTVAISLRIQNTRQTANASKTLVYQKQLQ